MIPLVEQLAATWASIDDLCADLGEEEWHRRTGCPGWTVKDQVSHLIDYEASALGQARPAAAADVSHTKNDLGAMNEAGVDARRSRTGADVLAELRQVSSQRLERLAALTEGDLVDEVATPIGPGTLGDLLNMRVMDTWTHEQDIRRALGRPGHDRGAVVDTVVAYFARFLPLLVAKRAAAPEGSTVVFEIDGQAPVCVEVVDGRGRLGAVPASPTAVLRMDAPTFSALVGGRSDAPVETVDVAGDEALAARVIGVLGFLP